MNPDSRTFLGRGLEMHDDVYIVAQSGDEGEQAFDREVGKATTHERRDLRLADAENLSGLLLR